MQLEIPQILNKLSPPNIRSIIDKVVQLISDITRRKKLIQSVESGNSKNSCWEKDISSPFHNLAPKNKHCDDLITPHTFTQYDSAHMDINQCRNSFHNTNTLYEKRIEISNIDILDYPDNSMLNRDGSCDPLQESKTSSSKSSNLSLCSQEIDVDNHYQAYNDIFGIRKFIGELRIIDSKAGTSYSNQNPINTENDYYILKHVLSLSDMFDTIGETSEYKLMIKTCPSINNHPSQKIFSQETFNLLLKKNYTMFMYEVKKHKLVYKKIVKGILIIFYGEKEIWFNDVIENLHYV